MTAIRSALFVVHIWLWTLVLSVVYLPLLVLPRKAMIPAIRLWLSGVQAGLRLIAGLSYELRGAENLPPGPLLIAAKHQSAFETFVFHLLLNDPAFILKRELLWIPFFGWYLGRSGVIAIDRSAGTKALKAMVKGAEDAVAQGRPVIIFPEGTRAPPGEKLPYHTGIAMIYGALKVPVVPIALNSGLFWRRRGFLKKPGIITIEALPAIPPGMDRKAFMAELESRIETATDRLVAEARQRFPDAG
ncbi:acyl-phosphate glycerol 3-phosphate acyltransferase [Paramagnetospirillum marisnigri]|uniref:Acyl-phosphate glycerol 3-phosphate acyltransferase n=1 Tax=Paramagnetospirillum marisnigri TaxID=1285242 RepID=A0A178MEU0_9PROT|nr:lysophospholipid acyltransferase family protein [Paramagnetospirillum marisnigri]OAN46565.1 acyl-phosphate glycerol 3-phosphate acyltransferase [Paramagnetospirillum marisnigri]